MAETPEMIQLTVVSLAGNVLLNVEGAPGGLLVKDLEVQVEHAMSNELLPLRGLVLENQMLDSSESLKTQAVRSGSVIQARLGFNATFHFSQHYAMGGVAECLQIHVVVSQGNRHDFEETFAQVGSSDNANVLRQLSEGDGRDLLYLMVAEQGHCAFHDKHGYEPSFAVALDSQPQEAACLKRLLNRARSVSFFEYEREPSHESYILGAEGLVDEQTRISFCYHSWDLVT